jgi:GAF domain-containing protein
MATGTREEQVALTLVQLADTLSDTTDEHDMYEILAERSAEILEVTATALLINNNRGLPKLVATGGEAISFDTLIDIQRIKGPCLECCQTGQAIHVERLADYRDTWPKFVTSVLAAGFRSVHSFPMAIRDQNFGALTLFSAHDRSMSNSELAIARAMTNVSTISLLQSRALREAEEMGQQLQRALNKRIATEQAKGRIAQRLTVEISDADDMLNRFAETANRRSSDVAADILSGNIPLENLLRPRESR